MRSLVLYILIVGSSLLKTSLLAETTVFDEFVHRVSCWAELQTLARAQANSGPDFQKALDAFESHMDRENNMSPLLRPEDWAKVTKEFQIQIEKRLQQLGIYYVKVAGRPPIFGGPPEIRDVIDNYSHKFVLRAGPSPTLLNRWLIWLEDSIPGLKVEIDLFELHRAFTPLGRFQGAFSPRKLRINIDPIILLRHAPNSVLAHEILHAIANYFSRARRNFIFNGFVKTAVRGEDILVAYANSSFDEFPAQILSLYLDAQMLSTLDRSQTTIDNLNRTSRNLQFITNRYYRDLRIAEARLRSKRGWAQKKVTVLEPDEKENISSDHFRIETRKLFSPNSFVFVPTYGGDRIAAANQLRDLHLLVSECRDDIDAVLRILHLSEDLTEAITIAELQVITKRLWDRVSLAMKKSLAGSR